MLKGGHLEMARPSLHLCGGRVPERRWFLKREKRASHIGWHVVVLWADVKNSIIGFNVKFWRQRQKDDRASPNVKPPKQVACKIFCWWHAVFQWHWPIITHHPTLALTRRSVKCCCLILVFSSWKLYAKRNSLCSCLNSWAPCNPCYSPNLMTWTIELHFNNITPILNAALQQVTNHHQCPETSTVGSLPFLSCVLGTLSTYSGHCRRLRYRSGTLPLIYTITVLGFCRLALFKISLC